jgi:hypothetical protein
MADQRNVALRADLMKLDDILDQKIDEIAELTRMLAEAHECLEQHGPELNRMIAECHERREQRDTDTDKTDAEPRARATMH